MARPLYWEEAKEHLCTNFVLADLVYRYEGEALHSKQDSFETLMRSIVGQQISVKAAQSVWDKLVARFGGARPNPGRLLELGLEELRSCGLSYRKAEYCLDLATHFQNHHLNPATWALKSDEQIIEELTQVRGIGRWSAEMFLIFHLLRPDVLPLADLGLQKSISIHFETPYPCPGPVMLSIAEEWRPFRSVATWYLWRALDPIPVEY